MNEQMFDAALKLVREGGQAAVYVVIAYYAIGLVKFMTGMGLLGYTVSRLYGIIRYGIDKSKNFKD